MFDAAGDRVTDEPSALRRVAALVAHARSSSELFNGVAEEVGKLVPGADATSIGRYDGETVEYVGGWSRGGDTNWIGERVPIGGHNNATLVYERRAPARVETIADDATAASAFARRWGIANTRVGAPILVADRLWGLISVASYAEDALPAGTEYQLASFAELVASAIANADARDVLQRVADEQAALRRVAVLVAHAASPEEVFTEIAGEIGGLFDVTSVGMIRYDSDATVLLSAWQRTPDERVPAPGTRVPLGGNNVTSRVFDTARPARLDDYDRVADGHAALGLRLGAQSAVAAPILVERALWGAVVVASDRGPLPDDTETRLLAFTELLGTAVANAQARLDIRRHADEDAALRRIAVLTARNASPIEVFAAVCEEIGQLLDVEFTTMNRYDDDGQVTIVGAWGRTNVAVPVGARVELAGRNVSMIVKETQRPARVDHYEDDAGPTPAAARASGMRSAAGAPIVVEDRVWGVLIAASSAAEPLPSETEARLVGFTELVATAIANAESQTALRASRARLVTTADETRRRIERDLHDGVQQSLVSLALSARAAQEMVPPTETELADRLDAIASELTDVVDDVREIAQGVHPIVLSKGGLRPALSALVARSTIPATLDVSFGTRLPEAIEVAAYYAVSEALTNCAKHSGATNVEVSAAFQGGELRVRVADNGRGGATLATGGGLVGVKDRVDALGGRLTLESDRKLGATLEIVLPVRPR